MSVIFFAFTRAFNMKRFIDNILDGNPSDILTVRKCIVCYLAFICEKRAPNPVHSSTA